MKKSRYPYNKNKKPKSSYSRGNSQQRGKNRNQQFSKYQGNQAKSRSKTNDYRNHRRNRALETIEDIRADIIRIEKEISLEIRQIKNLNLAL